MFRLEKTPGRDFVILNLSDPQMHRRDWAEGMLGITTLRYTMDELLKRVTPDLITITGDISYAGQLDSYENFVKFIESYGIRWAPIWGNHDNEYTYQVLDAAADILLSGSHCIFEKNDINYGLGNYVIRIEENGVPVEGMLMLDSHCGNERKMPDGSIDYCWAYLYQTQLDWIKEQSGALAADGCKEQMMMVHIPLFGFRQAFDEAFSGICPPEKVPVEESHDPKYWKPGYEGCFGVMHGGGVSSFPEERGQLGFIRSLGEIKYIFCGHDHDNNFVVPYQGMTLCYCTKTSTGCAGKGCPNGGTVITIGENGIKNIRHELVDIDDYYDRHRGF